MPSSRLIEERETTFDRRSKIISESCSHPLREITLPLGRIKSPILYTFPTQIFQHEQDKRKDHYEGGKGATVRMGL